MTDAVVVGGGLAGMSAAYRLQRAGADVTLLEKGHRLGGMVETSVEDGFLIESGPDGFVTGKRTVLDLAADLGVEDAVIPASGEGSFVWWDGRLHPLPGGLLLMVPSRLGPIVRTSLLSWRGKTVALKDLVLPRPGGNGDESLGSFVRRRLGAEVLERIAEPLVAGIHGADPETMSLRASFPRFLEMEAEHRSLILAARRFRASDPGGQKVPHFSSFRLGMGQLVTALERAIPSVDVRTGSDVTGLESTDGGYVVRLADGSRIAAEAVVLAVPAQVASRLLRQLAPEAAAHLVGIGQVSNQSVTMAFHTESMPRLAGTGFVVPAGGRPRIRGVSYLSRKWPDRVPDDGMTLLRVFLGDADEAPIEAARAGLAATIGVEVEPIRSWVRAHRQGLHRYTVGHLGRIEAAERALESVPGIALAGAGFHGVGLNEVIASGWAAAESVSTRLA